MEPQGIRDETVTIGVKLEIPFVEVFLLDVPRIGLVFLCELSVASRRGDKSKFHDLFVILGYFLRIHTHVTLVSLFIPHSLQSFLRSLNMTHFPSA